MRAILSLHDVSPHSWEIYQPFIERVTSCGDISLTLLVVPDFHRMGRMDRYPDFCRAMDAHVRRGDELVLHGYYHEDTAARPRTPGQWWKRRIATVEGEFSTLTESAAQEQIERGLTLFDKFGWPVDGFVAPGWQTSSGARAALSKSSFFYTGDRTHLYRLPDWNALEVPTLVWSARTAARRIASRAVNEWHKKHFSRAEMVRYVVHPGDLAHEDSFRFWLQCVRSEASHRRFVTKLQAINELAQPVVMPSGDGHRSPESTVSASQ